MSKTLVIVESPTKAKTIGKFLPKGFEVVSSMGHIRDLPSSAKEVPAKYKGEKWANLGVDVENGFEPLYVIPDKKKKTVKDLKDRLKNADELILATDEDREGEAISWHLLEILKPNVPVKRMVFHEITKEAIEEALSNFRQVDTNLVYAQEGRRILDRLVGYTVSPVLWKKVAPRLSAGRVQSVAVAILVERERERLRFIEAEYWDIAANLEKDNQAFKAVLTSVDGDKVATGQDFDKETGKLKAGADVKILDKAKAVKLVDDLEKAVWRVDNVETKEQFKSPAPPFITSTLQQEASRKLNWGSRQTMQVAQKLYEQGFITYMRTDSVNLSKQALAAARKCVESKYGKDYLSDDVRVYKSKAKGAQEAHEAIRPAGNTFIDPDKTGLDGEQLRLYDLIWKRTVATQMAEAKLVYTNATLVAAGANTQAEFKAKGKFIEFPGYYRAYVEGSDDPDAALEGQDELLPSLKENDLVDCKELESLEHFTKPPSRYTEASLIKALESNGIGRPSTYAAIMTTIQNRGYVRIVNKALVPTFIAFAVTQLLEKYFQDLVDLDFTADMEKTLDDIADGEVEWRDYLKSYYLGKKGLKEHADSVEDKIDPAESRKVEFPGVEKLGVDVLVGRYGPYIKSTGKEEKSASIPEEYAPSDLNADTLKKIMEFAASEGEPQGKIIGKDPASGKDVYIKIGRYGAYFQLGTDDDIPEGKRVPRRAGLPKGVEIEDADLNLALKYLQLPRELGEHPETGKRIQANIGRFGPYIVHDGDFRSVKMPDDVFDIQLERALEIFSEPKKGKGKKSAVKDFGEIIVSGKKKEKAEVFDGKYGLYIKCGKTNVSLPEGVQLDDLTEAKVIDLIKQKRG